MNCYCPPLPEGQMLFWCERHKCNKTAHWRDLCLTRADYRRLWDEGRGPGQEDHPSVDGKDKEHSSGPGGELKKIIAGWQRLFPWFDLSPHQGCSCNETAKWMDQLGPRGCEKQMDVILDKLEAEAKKRKLSIPFQRFWAARMVRQAIRRARKGVN